jgi:hypothetical protein
MQTYSLNSLAESFEIDRSTMVRALKNTLPDAEVTHGRPTWKIASAARALEQHRRKTGNSVGNSDSAGHPLDSKLRSLFSQLHSAEATLRKLPTLAKRRDFAIGSLSRIIDATQQMQHIVGAANNQDPVFTGLLGDEMYMLTLRGIEEPCGWTRSETWAAMNVEPD